MSPAAASTPSFALGRSRTLASTEEDRFRSRSRSRVVLELLQGHLAAGAAALDPERVPARRARVLGAVDRLGPRLAPRARSPWGSSVVAAKP